MTTVRTGPLNETRHLTLDFTTFSVDSSSKFLEVYQDDDEKEEMVGPRRSLLLFILSLFRLSIFGGRLHIVLVLYVKTTTFGL